MSYAPTIDPIQTRPDLGRCCGDSAAAFSGLAAGGVGGARHRCHLLASHAMWLCQLRRRFLCHLERSHPKWADLGGYEVGVGKPCGRQLASHNGVFPHVGLPAFQFEAVGTSFDQRAAARAQRRVGLRVGATDDRRGRRSLLVAALFALHPLRVESVAWVSERKDVLSGFFGLLALLAYAQYAQGSREKAESRKQKAEARVRKLEVRGQWPAVGGLSPISHLLSSIFYPCSCLPWA